MDCRTIFSHACNLYTAYPGVTAKEIKAMAAAADVSGAGNSIRFS